VSKPLHLSTNPEIFGEDCSISVWATGARKSTIKKNLKNKEKTISKIYSHSGKFAEWAKNVF